MKDEQLHQPFKELSLKPWCSNPRHTGLVEVGAADVSPVRGQHWNSMGPCCAQLALAVGGTCPGGHTPCSDPEVLSVDLFQLHLATPPALAQGSLPATLHSGPKSMFINSTV